jgi:hypothetical protein
MMHGHFSNESLEAYEALIADKVSLDFSEAQVYDFTRCVRPDGSAYGTGGKCRKGTREDKTEEPKPRKKRTETRNAAKAAKETEETDVKNLTKKSPVKRQKKTTGKVSSPDSGDKGAETAQRLRETLDETLSRLKKDKQISSPAPEKPPVENKTVITGGKRKVTEEKLKESFVKVLARLERAEQRGDSGAAYKAQESINLIRRAYHAVNKEEFLRVSAEISRNSRRAEELQEQAMREAMREGKTILQLGPSHPARKKWQESLDLNDKFQSLKERAQAAYFGEPPKTSPLSSKGGGTVSSAVPSSLPRGGADGELKNFLDSSEVVMAFPVSGFSKFVEQGIAKNGFESGTEGIKQGKRFYLDTRKNAEESVLDIPRNANPSERPVYAALEHPDRSRSLQGGEGKLMAQYGGVQVVFNDSVKDRSTFTYGDSIDFNEPRGIKASPVRDPANPISFGKKTQLSFNGDNPGSQNTTITTSKDGSEVTPPYMETQIHGGLRLSDVKEVRYYKGNEIDPKVKSLLEQQGIKIVELPPQMRDLDIRPNHPNFSSIETVAPPK